jgi:RNA binding exosome subunit
MVYKNIPADRLQPVMRIRFWLDYLAMAKLMLTGHFGNALAIIKARIAYKRLKKEYITIREENLSKRIVASIPEIFTKSLVLNFYFKGKKKFTELIPGRDF